jgi:acetylornithine deacetylase/succinyl-diaminopimelate desuccinylase-like protein
MALPPGFLDRARALIRANTVSDEGTARAVALLEPLYEEAGLRVQRQETEPGQINVLAGPGGAEGAPGGVLLVTHLDTVPAGPRERWTETGADPWALTEKDGVLYGLGCADVKLDALCKAYAALALRGRKLRRPFWLLGTYGEEVGLRGARHFAQSELFAQVRPAQVLCGEPSELQLIHAHKGYVVVRCTVTDARARLVQLAGLAAEELTFAGKAAHSSTPYLGVNAIARALQWSKESGTPVLSASGGAAANVVPARAQLSVSSPRDDGRPAPDEARLTTLPPQERPNLWRALATAGALAELWASLLAELQPRSDARFDPAGAVGGLNVLESGAAPAQPGAIYGQGQVTATLDARLLPQHDPDAFLQTFANAAQGWVERLGRGELSLQLEATRNASGMALPDDAPLVRSIGRVLERAGLDGAPRAKPTSTEAGVFARAGCEAIVFGPGRSTGNAHTANERIEIAQLERAIGLYQSLLVELCEGEG